jgi:hypothetical protein
VIGNKRLILKKKNIRFLSLIRAYIRFKMVLKSFWDDSKVDFGKNSVEMGLEG